jgi:hypothetical protein
LRLYSKKKIVKRLEKEDIYAGEKVVELYEGSYRTMGPQGFIADSVRNEAYKQYFGGGNTVTS